VNLVIASFNDSGFKEGTLPRTLGADCVLVGASTRFIGVAKGMGMKTSVEFALTEVNSEYQTFDIGP
jgi:hypothetical protein